MLAVQISGWGDRVSVLKFRAVFFNKCARFFNLRGMVETLDCFSKQMRTGCISNNCVCFKNILVLITLIQAVFTDGLSYLFRNSQSSAIF